MGENKLSDGRRFNAGVRGHNGSKAGRPILPDKEKRKLRSIRATDEEWERIKVFAKKIKAESGKNEENSMEI
ncbi:hypothetical protein [Selenomonas ruminantium]|uniref:hypothetical protein n=1 Tax=Selenomonas ruminantium TaxID=971 RepID=UPI0026EA0B1C|nr:hypothetical protein [Selenomonas ruminantium]